MMQLLCQMHCSELHEIQLRTLWVGLVWLTDAHKDPFVVPSIEQVKQRAPSKLR